MAAHAEWHLVWLDLEMTGLNPFRDAIVEVAFLVTDMDLRRLGESRKIAVWQPEEVLARMTPFARDRHAKSGITDRSRQSTSTLAGAEREILVHIAATTPPRQGLLAGNSVWVDRTFLAVQMPAIERYLHYQQVDVTGLKLMARQWFREAAAFEKSDSHEADRDIEESIAELAPYRGLFGVPS
jgi:oligoribonuclease